jgi:catechol 2,3-dioxygenase-like lactoylglutathione lyase family enzyme
MKHLIKKELDVGLVPTDAEAARTFYREIIGLTEQAPMDMGGGSTQYRFALGNHVIKLNALKDAPARESGGIDRANGIRMLAFYVDDFDALLGRIEKSGRRYSRMATPESANYQLAFAKDADGNMLELIGLKQPGGAALQTRVEIGLTVGETERSRKFYGEVLGLPELPTMQMPGGGTRYAFKAGNTTIKFWHQGELPTKTGNPHKRAGLRYYTALVDDLDAVHAELVAKGATIKVAPMNFGGTARIMFVADPDGNWIEFVQAAASA